MKELESMGLLSPVVSGGLNVQNGEESKSESDYDYVYVERPLQGARDPRMFSGHVAVVGMGGRFPTSLPSESCDVKGLWKLLCSGGDALRRFSRNELIDRGVPASTLDNTDYVCAGQALGSADATTFDAFFFGIGGSEARLIGELVACFCVALQDGKSMSPGLRAAFFTFRSTATAVSSNCMGSHRGCWILASDA